MEDHIIYAKLTCYNLLNEAAWDINSLKELLYNRHYRFVTNIDLLIEKLFVCALSFAKYNDYIDLIMLRMERKNGSEFSYNIFRQVFPQFKDVNDLCDYCFNVCSYEEIDVKEEAKKLGINSPLMLYYAKKSKLGTLSKDIDRVQKRKENIRENYPNECAVIDFLLTHDNHKEIVDYLSKHDGDFNGSKLLIFANAILCEMSSDEVKEKVMKKYHYYIHYKKTVINAPIGRIKSSIKKVSEFTNGPYVNYKSFLLLNGVDKDSFERAINLVMVHDKNLYLAFKEKIKNLKSRKYPDSFLSLRQIALYIINGINHREFTILDYLKMTDCPVHNFYYIVADSFKEDELMILRKFYTKYCDMQLIKPTRVMNLQKEVNCQLEEKGFPIPGTERFINKEEISRLLKQIENDGYPLYDAVYNIYLKNYLLETKGKQKIK